MRTAAKKTLSLALAAVLALGSMTAVPLTASAAEIQAGMPNITIGTSSSTPTTIGFGGHEWVVIGYNGTGVASESNTMTLLLKNGDAGGGYGTAQFHSSSNYYSGSSLQSKMNDAYDGLPDGEKELVAARTLAGGSANYDSEGHDNNKVAGEAVSGAHFWPLSVNEANQLDEGIRKYSGYWWLRSPGSTVNDAAVVDDGGGYVSAYGDPVSSPKAVRPAFQLDLAFVLFASAAAGGKSDVTVGDGLVATEEPDSAVKLTMLDDDLTIDIDTQFDEPFTPGAAVTIGYNNTTTTDGLYISCVLADENQEVKYYGKLAETGNNSGQVEFDLPDDIPDGDYTVRLFVEEVNGDNETDFASQPEEIALTVQASGGGNVSDWTGKTVYFGKNTLAANEGPSGDQSPILWKVMEEDNGALTLLSVASLGKRKYDPSKHKKWSKSNIAYYLNSTGSYANTGGLLRSAFKAAERAAMQEAYSTVEEHGHYDADAFTPNQTIVLPSVDEVKEGGLWGWNQNSDRDISEIWWLRSPGSGLINTQANAAVIYTSGAVYEGGSSVSSSYAIRPAFKLDLSSVLFTSAAGGGKSDATVGDGLVVAEEPDGAVKLTVKDSDRDNLNLNVTSPREITKAPGDTVRIAYTGAVTGERKYVSAVLADEDDGVLYYGKLVDLETGGGSSTASFTVPGDIEQGEYTLKLFNEEVNGDNETDFASNPVNIILTVDENGGGSGQRPNRNNSDYRTQIIPSIAQPDRPTIGSFTGKVAGTNTQATFTVTDGLVEAALEQAQTDAKAQSRSAYGVGVRLSLDTPAATSLTLTLERAALNRLVSAGAKQFELTGAPISLNFDAQALAGLQKQGTGNVTLTAKPVTVKGVRNACDIMLTTVKDGKTVNITSLGNGSAALSIPTKPGKNEAEGYLYAVYVDAKGNLNHIADSFYDANSGRVIFSTNHFSVYGVGYTAPSAKFTDAEKHWAKESIDYVVGRGLFGGNAEGKFSPDAAITRGDFVTALGRLAGVDTKAYTISSFTDVKADSYCLPYIEWAYSKGIIQGVVGNQFTPDGAITRQEIAVILQNYAKSTDYVLPITRTAVTFADAEEIGGVYAKAVTVMQQAGIMMGKQNNKFNPTLKATRAEASAMLHRYIKLTIEPATAQGWAKNDDGQYLYYKDGKAVTGTQTIDNVKYFFNTDGMLKTGWVKDDAGNWRFYSGNILLVGFWDLDTNGSNKRYYFDTYGNMIAGKWLQIDDKWYYFYADGSLAKSTKVDGYEVDENGIRKTT